MKINFLKVQWPNSDTFQPQSENEDLEYIGPPTDYATSLVDIREWPESLQEPPNVSVRICSYLSSRTNSTALSLSQDLSPLPMPSETSDLSTNWTTRSRSQELPRPAPPPLSPPPRADETAIPSGSLEEEDQVASHHINLEFDERNIVSGKRRRTVSSRAADAIALRPTKKGPLSRRQAGSPSRPAKVPWRPPRLWEIYVLPYRSGITAALNLAIINENLNQWPPSNVKPSLGQTAGV
ncbi:hypothetical protein C8R45DRAFT_933713 [Mycena sanguinolenta]|nr:hypothetical protein C8R45DRAFT_933713 [Mycena sanguinolenta]